MQFLAGLAGWRTYLAQGANALFAVGTITAAIATYSGALGMGSGLAFVAVLLATSQLCNALGGIFQRMATQDLKANLAELPTDLVDVEQLVQKVLEAAKAINTPVMPDVPPRQASSSSIATALIVVGLLLCGSAAMASPPIAIIQGPKSAEPGEEILLDLSMSEGEPMVYGWQVYPKIPNKKQLTIAKDGKTCRLASFPGVYTVQGQVANMEGINTVEWTITIPGNPPCPSPPNPTPAPGPSPVPTPTPVVPVPVVPVPVVPVVPVPVPPDALPAGEFDGLPAAVRALALTVNSPTRAAEAAKLADAFDSLASQIVAVKTLQTPLAIVDAIGKAFNSSVPASWDAGFRAKAVARMKEIYEGGKLATPERWAAMLREVSVGLRAVK